MATSISSNGAYCGDYGGAAVVGNNVYLPCISSGVEEFTLGSNDVGTHDWTQSQVNGSPIVAGGYVWAMSKSSGILDQLNPSTGAVVNRFSVGSISTSFPTPAESQGFILAPASNAVVAFTG